MLLAIGVWAWTLHGQALAMAGAASEVEHRWVAAADRVAELGPALVSTRIQYDPEVATATSEVQSGLDAGLCAAARDAVNAGATLPVVDPAIGAEVAAVPARSKVLAEVPGWEARMDRVALQARVDTCAEAARAEAEAARKAEEARKAAARKKAARKNAETDCGPGWFFQPMPYGGECLPTEEWLEEDQRRHESGYEVPERTTNAHGDVIEKAPGY